MKSGKEEFLRNRKIFWITAFWGFVALMIFFLCSSLMLGAWKEYSVGIVFSIFLFLFFVSIGGVFYSHKRLNDYRVRHLKAGVPRSEENIETNVVYRLLGRHSFPEFGLCLALNPIKNEGADNMSKPFFSRLSPHSGISEVLGDLEKNNRQLFMLLDDINYVVKDDIQVIDGRVYPKGEPTLTVSNNDYGGEPYVLECRENRFFFVNEEIRLFLIRGEPSREQNKEEEDNQKEEESQS